MSKLFSLGVEVRYFNERDFDEDALVRTEKYLFRSPKNTSWGWGEALTQDFNKAKKWGRKSDAIQSIKSRANHEYLDAARKSLPKHFEEDIRKVQVKLIEFDYVVKNVKAEEIKGVFDRDF